MEFETLCRRALAIREQYRRLELQHHQEAWSVNEDALAFLSDAGLLGRLTMEQQQRWLPADQEASQEVLKHKLGECVWWLTVLADRMNLDLGVCTDDFLRKTEQMLAPKSSADSDTV